MPVPGAYPKSRFVMAGSKTDDFGRYMVNLQADVSKTFNMVDVLEELQQAALRGVSHDQLIASLRSLDKSSAA